jgi:hypothetical protein
MTEEMPDIAFRAQFQGIVDPVIVTQLWHGSE